MNRSLRLITVMFDQHEVIFAEGRIRKFPPISSAKFMDAAARRCPSQNWPI